MNQNCERWERKLIRRCGFAFVCPDQAGIGLSNQKSQQNAVKHFPDATDRSIKAIPSFQSSSDESSLFVTENDSQ
jgi:hypothetical protein